MEALGRASISEEGGIPATPEALPTDTTAVVTDAGVPSSKKFSFKSMFNWYWPTSVQKASESELSLLVRGGIPMKDTKEHQLLNVSIGDGKYIHTLVLNQNQTQGKNVVLTHGFGAGLAFFYKNLGALAALPGTRVYAIDWLGKSSGDPPFTHPHPSPFTLHPYALCDIGMGRSSRPTFPKYRPDPKWQAKEVSPDRPV